jgi:hypothetical protein
MRVWTPVSFNLSTDTPSAGARDEFRATDTRLIRARVTAPVDGDPAYRFFKLDVRRIETAANTPIPA